MRVLCCLDGTNVEQVSKATEMLLATQSLTLGILYVIDTGPRKDIEHTRERFLRPPGPPGPREHEMQQAEHAAAEDILNEATALPSQCGNVPASGAARARNCKRCSRVAGGLSDHLPPRPNTAANPLSALDRSDMSPDSSSTMLLVRCCWFGR